ncbi:hypothetical protein IL306_007584 [Fusarium sp. DS 682]|nr:hypothetical protein IL306_007584 [Fusarium sp. DS 682]
MPDPTNPNAYTIGWVSALSIEFTAAQEYLDEEYDGPEHREPNDHNSYAFGRIKSHLVVIAVLPKGEYGTATAASVAKDMLRSFPNVRIGLLVGIGGGVPSRKHDIRLGDVVVSSPTPNHGGIFQYDYGKAVKEGFQQTRSLNQPPDLLLGAIAGLQSQHDRKGNGLQSDVERVIVKNTRLRSKYGRPPAETDVLFASHTEHKDEPCVRFCITSLLDIIVREPRGDDQDDVEVHYGTIASANTLMKDAIMRDELGRSHDILCFEMEAAGLMNRFPCLVIRGICDYCDCHKSKVWQGFASMVAAAYAKQVISRIRPEAVEQTKTITSQMEAISSRVEQVLSEVQSMKRTQEETQALDWLSSIDFGAHHSDESKRQSPGTCQWFLNSEKYLYWLEEKGQVLFCPGIAGAGKTVLASVVIEDLHSRFGANSSIATANIYCNYNRKNRQAVNEILACLIRQLCERLSPIPEDVLTVYKEYRHRAIDVPTERICSVMESVSAFFSKVFVVVDALDEWQPRDQERPYSLLDKLLFLQKKLCFSLLATSRPVPLIQHQFNDHPSLPILAQEEDIYAHIDGYKWPISSCIAGDSMLMDLIKTELPHVVKGVFLLANLYLGSLEAKTTRRDVKDALKRFTDRAKRKSCDPEYDILGEVYQETIQRLEEQNKEHKQLAFRVLAWICRTNKEFSIKEVQHGLALREGDTELQEDAIVDGKLLVSVCCGLVEISEASRTIRLSHYTIEDYFQHNYHLFQDADAYIAKQCISYLSLPLPELQEGLTIDIGPVSVSQEELEDMKGHYALKEATKEYPLYRYAANNWGNHVRNLPPSKQVDETFKLFLRRQKVVQDAVLLMLELPFRLLRTYKRSQADGLMNDLDLAAYFGLSDLALALIECHGIESYNIRRSALSWAIEGYKMSLWLARKPLSPFKVIDIGGVMQALLAAGADPNGPNGAECPEGTPLHSVAELGERDLAQTLLQYKARVDISNADGDVPLILAARHGKGSVMRLLLDHGIAADLCGKNRRTVLIEAASIGNEALAREMIERGVRVDFQDGFGRSALIVAAMGGHSSIIEILLAHGANPDLQDDEGNTALIKASSRGHSSAVKLLLSKKASPNLQDSTGSTALADASFFGHSAIVGLLLAENANPNVRDRWGKSALIKAIQYHRLDVVRVLLAKDAHRIDQADSENGLIVASNRGNEAIVSYLLRRGVRTTVRNSYHRTALVAASENGHLGIVSLLLSHRQGSLASMGIDAALSQACCVGNRKVIKFLLYKGAKANSKDEYFASPLVVAIRHRRQGIFKLLLDAGANPEGLEKEETKPLHEAVKYSRKQMVEDLISKGADIHRRLEGTGLTPLMMTKECSEFMADFLREKGAVM